MKSDSRLIAILEIGSTGIRLLVAEIFEAGEWLVLDRADKSVALGRDVFISGRISRESFLECLAVLKNFQELLRGWEIAPRDVHVIATSALRIARNRDVFVDRVLRETGYLLNVVEGIEENRLMYLAVRYALKNDLPQFWRANSMIVEVGGGSTEIMLLRRGKMVAAHSLNLGTIFIDQQSRVVMGSTRFQERFLNENVRNTSEFLSSEMDLAHVRTFVVAGSDVRFAAEETGAVFNPNCRIISRDAFISFAERVKNCSADELVRNHRIPFADAEGFSLGIMVYRLFLERTAAAQVIVPSISIREGLLIDLTRGVEAALQEEFFSQVIASAVNLGRKFHYDETHNRHVADLCMAIFDALVYEHGLLRRERMMLEVAAILHDVGMFIQSSDHHKHGRYIVANSEIFGLHRDELNIIANVISYHRGPPPDPSDIDYIALQREERILVLKMASILRVADALDRGHSQHIKNITVEKKGEILVLHSPGNYDFSLEHRGLEEKADMFQDVFGYKVVLT
ncbi:MAG: HD domain-containing protein [Spirochaetaceae bacterium]|jgi:exopolyphosphatase/guanosine-5'-triphosphate,3'-diphosphate pyrophosphatase|nr:HD domain-containing protein [Spirochaetaceae bacterium]